MKPSEPTFIGWRLRVLMAERDIRTTRALRRRLSEFGVSISEPQLGRIVAKLPHQLNIELLRGLCSVLGVAPGDLLVVPQAVRHNAPASPAAPPSAAETSASPAPPASPPSYNASIGPRATPFPMPKVKSP